MHRGPQAKINKTACQGRPSVVLLLLLSTSFTQAIGNEKRQIYLRSTLDIGTSLSDDNRHTHDRTSCIHVIHAKQVGEVAT
ncbi:hypothetical protein F5X98DRAFT_312411 [Xylaria grammica]|nr:hypothetical protein F5X98DRAFT_312411 [Xylaria grammica]